MCVCVFGYVVACGCLRLLVVVTCFGVCYCSCWCCSLQFAVVVVFVGGRACHGLHCPQIMHKYGDNSASLLHAAVYAELQLCCCACHVRARQHNISWPHEHDSIVRSLAMMPPFVWRDTSPTEAACSKGFCVCGPRVISACATARQYELSGSALTCYASLVWEAARAAVQHKAPMIVEQHMTSKSPAYMRRLVVGRTVRC